MNYSSYEKDKETYFKYSPMKNNTKKITSKVINKENPFNVLKNINFK